MADKDHKKTLVQHSLNEKKSVSSPVRVNFQDDFEDVLDSSEFDEMLNDLFDDSDEFLEPLEDLGASETTTPPPFPKGDLAQTQQFPSTQDESEEIELLGDDEIFELSEEDLSDETLHGEEELEEEEQERRSDFSPPPFQSTPPSTSFSNASQDFGKTMPQSTSLFSGQEQKASGGVGGDPFASQNSPFQPISSPPSPFGFSPHQNSQPDFLNDLPDELVLPLENEDDPFADDATNIQPSSSNQSPFTSQREDWSSSSSSNDFYEDDFGESTVLMDNSALLESLGQAPTSQGTSSSDEALSPFASEPSLDQPDTFNLSADDLIMAEDDEEDFSREAPPLWDEEVEEAPTYQIPIDDLDAHLPDFAPDEVELNEEIEEELEFADEVDIVRPKREHAATIPLARPITDSQASLDKMAETQLESHHWPLQSDSSSQENSVSASFSHHQENDRRKTPPTIQEFDSSFAYEKQPSSTEKEKNSSLPIFALIAALLLSFGAVGLWWFGVLDSLFLPKKKHHHKRHIVAKFYPTTPADSQNSEKKQRALPPPPITEHSEKITSKTALKDVAAAIPFPPKVPLVRQPSKKNDERLKKTHPTPPPPKEKIALKKKRPPSRSRPLKKQRKRKKFIVRKRKRGKKRYRRRKKSTKTVLPKIKIVRKTSPKPKKKTLIAAASAGLKSGQAKLILSVRPTCTLYVDGKKKGETASTLNLLLKAGTHRFLCVNKKRFLRKSFSVTLKSGEVKHYKKIFRMGTLLIYSDPWATIFIKGLGTIGRTGRRISLAAGRYRLILYKKGNTIPGPGMQEVRIVTIRPGRTTTPATVKFPNFDEE